MQPVEFSEDINKIISNLFNCHELNFKNIPLFSVKIRNHWDFSLFLVVSLLINILDFLQQMNFLISINKRVDQDFKCLNKY
jgi:hypothetical protein